jgi:cardiolipin synthase
VVGWVLATSLNYAIVVILISRILLQRRESGATLAWVFFVLLVPYLGLLAFWAFGTTRIRLKRRKRARVESTMAVSLAPLTAHLRAGEHEIPEFPAEAYQAAKRIGGRGPTPGNRVHLFRHGPEVLEALETAIEQAQHHVHVEFYIWKQDASGVRLRDALVRAAKRGIKVRLLLDDVGTRIPVNRFFAPLTEAGGQVRVFLPVALFSRRLAINNRNHRKIVVVDGRLGFTGGMNVGDEYLGEGPGTWRDAFVRVEGPAALQFQEVFCEDWFHATGEDQAQPEYFPDHRPAGNEWVQVLSSGPADQRWPAIHTLMFTCVTLARERVWVETPYCVPDQPMLKALEVAALRGVDVRLYLPGQADHPLVYHAGRSFYDELLRAGVKIFELPRTMLHAKTMVVDSQISTVGSTNMDQRSFQLNFEINAFFYGTHMNHALADSIEAVAGDAQHVRLKAFRRRPRRDRALEATARLFAPLL